MIENLAQLVVERAGTRPELRIGALDDPVRLTDALAIAAGGAELLRAKGITADHRAAVIAGSSTDYLVEWLNCLLAGVPVALINPTYPAELLARMVDTFDPAVVFTDQPSPGQSFTGGRPVHLLAECRNWPVADPAAAPGIGAPGRPSPRTCTPRAPPACRSSAPSRTTTFSGWARCWRKHSISGRPTGCSRRCRCSTSTPSVTAFWARSPQARTR